MIHHNTYRSHLRKIAEHEVWLKQFIQKSGWISVPAGAKPPVKVTNDMRAEVEVYEWHKNPPDTYFLYVDEAEKKVTNWTGEVLGRCIFGTKYTDNFGGKRVPITVIGTNGVNYHGTYFESSGTYARIKAYK